MKIAITGANGLVGLNVVQHFLLGGHQVKAMVRSPEKMLELDQKQIHRWSTDDIPESSIFSDVDVVVHLAGENIAGKRWTAARKEELKKSRIDGTKNLVAAIKKLTPEQRPKVLISASAIGYYGSHPDQEFDESSSAGSDFLADLCVAWEKEAFEASDLGMRVICLRLGLVLAKEGGFLSMAGPVVLGDGRQWMSWIHVKDICRFIELSIQNEKVRGSYNLTSPEPVTQKKMTQVLNEKLGFPLALPAPKLALKTVLGELSQAVLSSQKVYPKKTMETGFQFEFKTLKSALDEIYGPMTFMDSRYLCTQFVPRKKSEIFSFFSEAENLETLTPPWLNFRILKKSTPSIQEGTLIDYKLQIHGVPVRWRTLISNWSPELSFVDEQLKGPYTKWHHTHTFEEVPGGTLIRDEVIYRVPGWIFGKAILSAWIRRDVTTIFNYRKNKIRDLWRS